MKVIRIVAAPGFVTHEESLARVGHYVVSFDPDSHGGRGLLRSSPNLEDARRFADAGEAMDYWRQQSTVAPIRLDGKPNRPLTAFTIEVLNDDVSSDA